MAIAEYGSMPKVKGNSSDSAAMPPRPGMTPAISPRMTPPNKSPMRKGVNSTCNAEIAS